MNFNPILIVPELFMLLLVAALFVQSLGPREWEPTVEKWLPIFSGLGVLVAISSFHVHGLIFYDTYKIDLTSQFFKIAIMVGFTVAVANASRQPTLRDDKRSDYYFLMATSAWGLMLMASAVELITVYMAMEISSYSLFTLLPLRAKSKPAAEAGIKYILFGAVATAVSLYGFSYILASQHTSYIAELVGKDWSLATNPMGAFGLLLFLCGMFYKLALFPFHFWCPDAYQGSSNETAAYMATLPKLGSVVVLIRLATFLKPGMEVTTVIAVFGAVSMTFGNLSALAQKDVKRILGFSSVAHAGYVTVGLVSGTAMGLAAASFYAVAYLMMNLLCFWILSRVAADGRNLDLDGLNGLYKRAPVLAFALAAGAFALVGLPPTMGFIGKFFLITSAWNHGYNWLVIVLAVNSAIAIYYYLSLVRHAYTHEAEDDAPLPDNSLFSRTGAGILAVIVLALGLVPSPLFDFAVQAGRQLIP